MKDCIYIVFNKRGIRSLTKRTKNSTLPPGTYMAELNLEVDNSFFDNQIPKVEIKLENEKIIKPEVKVEAEKPTNVQMFFSEIDSIDERVHNLDKKRKGVKK